MLVAITPDTFDVELDIRYATSDNVSGKPIYTRPACYLNQEAAEKLQEAIRQATTQGLRFKLFDGFRPLEGQQALWDAAPDPSFVSDPETGSCPHCRGAAIDLTLIDKDGQELDMGTGFDDFTPQSHHGNREISSAAQQNRFLLLGIMTAAGWDFYRNEWWHYQLFDPRRYPKLTDAEAGTNLI